MSASEFIINTLKKWESLFPGIKVKYAYEELTSYHVITVEPGEIYSSDDYISKESEFWDSFMEKYPEEDMLISEPNCCLEMKNVLYPKDSFTENLDKFELKEWTCGKSRFVSSFVFSCEEVKVSSVKVEISSMMDCSVFDIDNYSLAA